jgi:hypothetical protein
VVTNVILRLGGSSRGPHKGNRSRMRPALLKMKELGLSKYNDIGALLPSVLVLYPVYSFSMFIGFLFLNTLPFDHLFTMSY